MTLVAMKTESERFKRAIYISITVHVVLFIFLLVSPHIRLPSSKRMIHYVNIFSTPGSGGGGGTSESVNLETPAQEELTETIVPKRESLQDLTVQQKTEEQDTSSLRYPVDKPKREITPPEEKKAVIEKQTKPISKKPEQTSSSATGESDSGSETGIKIGIGGGEGSGEGSGSGFESEIGLSNFPFSYYLRQLSGKLSNYWVKSYSGAEELFTTVFFKIYRDGSVRELKVVESSGNRILDRSTISAITHAEPFAPLPQAYSYDYLEIQLIFEHGK
ncbi:TonB family protein [Acidobacteriota bacterium]